MEIIGDIKTYHWGKLGANSEVAKLAKLNSNAFEIDDGTPYSELWIGAHSSGPSKIKATGQELGNFIDTNKNELIGGLNDIPFLFKVLSIRQALSIQVHPNKEEAEKLHSQRPDIYKDPNHKPELAIALTPFLALCGFRPYKEIYSFCQTFKPLSDLIGEENVKSIELKGAEGLKTGFAILMNSTEQQINETIGTIAKNYVKDLIDNNLNEIFNTLNSDFPNDVGTLCLFFFNIIRLKPGEAIFLPANEPHAYLYGDCIECMACSDNVIRAGLTPKFKDIPTLIRMLNYEAQSPQSKLFMPRKVDEFVELFAPTIKDFAVAKINIPVTEKLYKMENKKFGSVLLCLSGNRIIKTGKLKETRVQKGSILFIPGNAGPDIQFISTENETENFIAYQAMYNSFI